jgi:lysophospholipase L1-like esterase
MELFQGEVTVNMMASSRGMDNEDYFKELSYLLDRERFCYQAIHLNNGLHGNHLNGDEYERLLEQTVHFIQSKSDAAIIIALSTPVYHDELEYNHENNDRVTERNRSARLVADRNGLPVNDLYAFSYGKEEIRIGDGYHYNAQGSKLQAEQVVGCLRTAMRKE